MAGPRDDELILRSAADGDLTADETIAFTLDSGVHTQKPLAVHVVFPEDPGASDTAVVVVRCVTDDHKVFVSHTDSIATGQTFPQEVVLPIPPSKGTSWELFLNITDGGGGFDAGEVLAWIELEDTAAKVPVTP